MQLFDMDMMQFCHWRSVVELSTFNGMTHQVCKQDRRINRFSDTGTELEPVFLRGPFEIPKKKPTQPGS